MLKKILIGFVVIVAAFFGLAALQPADFTFTRSVSIDAAPEVVFAQVNDFHKWQAWSPWANLDPSMKTTYSGPEAGLGAGQAWEGNGEVGVGKMTILKSEAPSLIQIQLDFLKPMEAHNLTEFRFEPEASGTLVTWTMSGQKNLISKAMWMVMSMDKLLGPQFDRGLASLKSVSESQRL